MRYSDYTVEQLREELGQLKEASQRAEQLGDIQEVVIVERKMQMVASYLLNPEDYEIGEIYEIQGDPGYTFKISFLEGVMAWGIALTCLEMKRKSRQHCRFLFYKKNSLSFVKLIQLICFLLLSNKCVEESVI